MATRTTTSWDIAAELAFLSHALKAPALLDAADRLAERARAESWTHQEYLAACLRREVAARESHGGEGRIRAARFPARKTLQLSWVSGWAERICAGRSVADSVRDVGAGLGQESMSGLVQSVTSLLVATARVRPEGEKPEALSSE
ncbi:hypothetical protein ACWC0A_23620 [Streptomyces scopuliridis]